jgi:hypothetical protein
MEQLSSCHIAISFDQIQRLDPVAADYLRFISCIDPRDIPLSLLPPYVKQQKVLGLLKAYSFITDLLWQEYLPHFLFILQSKEFQDDPQDRVNLVQQVARCFHNDGRYDQAGALLEEVLEKKNKRLKNDDEEILIALAWMAFTYRKQGDDGRRWKSCRSKRWRQHSDLSIQTP